MTLLHIEPPSIPPLQQCVQRHSKVLAHHSIAQLKIHAADHLGTIVALLLQLEQVTKEVEVGKDSEIRLTEMDADRYVQYAVRVKVAQTNSP